MDGGAKPSLGSIGFVLASADKGNPIVTCWGQPAGINPQSYCSEICSLLATVCLLCLLVEFFNARIHPPKVVKNTFKIYTDSKSMPKKLERMDEYPSAPLKMVLAPDWDVLQAVYNELKCNKLSIGLKATKTTILTLFFQFLYNSMYMQMNLLPKV